MIERKVHHLAAAVQAQLTDQPLPVGVDRLARLEGLLDPLEVESVVERVSERCYTRYRLPATW